MIITLFLRKMSIFSKKTVKKPQKTDIITSTPDVSFDCELLWVAWGQISERVKNVGVNL
jgi:hypothetical protein